MGEVYRADDLELSQAVALKLLPASLSQDALALNRLRGEVRLARQISHPNVCRVFDLAHFEDQYFLIMEYIDGEDLSRVLCRMGRPSKEKARQIARQICLGLSAVHDHGILHRDLKPANIMIDGRGRVRVTDFGLAQPVSDSAGQESAGTPAYMAPEQLEGKGASIASDVYALGSVLYELLTGVPAIPATRLAEIREIYRKGAAIFPPSHLAPDIEPQVDAVVLKCLATESAKRPSSAVEVAKAFPGGDALGEALAAGETPSPALVAASGGKGTLPARVAWSLLAGVLILVGGCITAERYSTVLGVAGYPKSPDVLSDRARSIIKSAGYTDAAVDSAFGIYANGGYLSFLARREDSRMWRHHLAESEPGAARFWYRQSNTRLQPSNRSAVVTKEDPPHQPGMVDVLLDSRGNLRDFRANPDFYETEPSAPRTTDWSPLLAAAEINVNELKPADPHRVPPMAFDLRTAWDGSRLGSPIHVDAAAFHGKPVFFEVTGEWSGPAPSSNDWIATVGDTGFIVLAISLWILGALLARRHLKLGRGDRAGATRVCLYFFISAVLSGLLQAHLSSSISQIWAVGSAGVADAMFITSFLWLFYMSLEPYSRKYFPEMLISWSRVLQGKFNDPLVGRDALIGVLGGCAVGLLVHLAYVLPLLIPVPKITPLTIFPHAISTPFESAGYLLGLQVNAMLSALGLTFTLVCGWLWFRNKALAISLAYLVGVVLGAPGENYWVTIPLRIIVQVISIFVLIRFGVLAFGIASFVANVVIEYPLTWDLSCWYAGRSLLAFAVIIAFAAYGFYRALGSQPVMAGLLAEE